MQLSKNRRRVQIFDMDAEDEDDTDEPDDEMEDEWDYLDAKSDTLIVVVSGSHQTTRSRLGSACSGLVYYLLAYYPITNIFI